VCLGHIQNENMLLKQSASHAVGVWQHWMIPSLYHVLVKILLDISLSKLRWTWHATVPCIQGNIAARAGDLMAARAHFMDAVSLEADCVEAIYNLGLVSKGVGNLDDALTAFKRLNAMLTDDTAAMFQVCPVQNACSCNAA